MLGKPDPTNKVAPSPRAVRKACFLILLLSVSQKRTTYQIIVIFCYLLNKVNLFFCELHSNLLCVLVTQILRKISSNAHLQIFVKNTEERHTLMAKGTIIFCMHATTCYILNTVNFLNMVAR